jgi:hypothetical protein
MKTIPIQSRRTGVNQIEFTCTDGKTRRLTARNEISHQAENGFFRACLNYGLRGAAKGMGRLTVVRAA